MLALLNLLWFGLRTELDERKSGRLVNTGNCVGVWIALLKRGRGTWTARSEPVRTSVHFVQRSRAADRYDARLGMEAGRAE